MMNSQVSFNWDCFPNSKACSLHSFAGLDAEIVLESCPPSKAVRATRHDFHHLGCGQ